MGTQGRVGEDPLWKKAVVLLVVISIFLAMALWGCRGMVEFLKAVREMEANDIPQ